LNQEKIPARISCSKSKLIFKKLRKGENLSSLFFHIKFKRERERVFK